MEKLNIPWAKPYFGREELEEVIDSFESDWLTMGKKVERFETQMAELLCVPHAVAVTNGTVALDVALKTVGIQSGDEVIVPAMTYFATAASVSYQNATPVFVDIESDTYNLDPKRIGDAITDKTKAIVFIDYGGNPAQYDEIARIGSLNKLPVIQDAAQSLGSVYKGSPAGAQTDISTMSFHLAKVMTCVEGGMIFTHNQDYFHHLRALRNQGEPSNEKYTHIALGTNARMTDINAAIGLAQIKKLAYMLEERRRVAYKYNELFKICTINGIVIPSEIKGNRNAYFFYPILINNRNDVADKLRDDYGVDTRIAYPMPVYKQPVYRSGELHCRHLDCPVAEDVTSRVLNLPIFPGMGDEQIEDVVRAIQSESS